jgi:hypothetical protein
VIEHPELVGTLNGNGNGKDHGPHAPDHGVWRGEDFMI